MACSCIRPQALNSAAQKNPGSERVQSQQCAQQTHTLQHTPHTNCACHVNHQVLSRVFLLLPKKKRKLFLHGALVEFQFLAFKDVAVAATTLTRAGRDAGEQATGHGLLGELNVDLGRFLAAGDLALHTRTGNATQKINKYKWSVKAIGQAHFKGSSDILDDTRSNSANKPNARVTRVHLATLQSTPLPPQQGCSAARVHPRPPTTHPALKDNVENIERFDS